MPLTIPLNLLYKFRIVSEWVFNLHDSGSVTLLTGSSGCLCATSFPILGRLYFSKMLLWCKVIKKMSFFRDPTIGLYPDYVFPDDVNCIVANSIPILGGLSFSKMFLSCKVVKKWSFFRDPTIGLYPDYDFPDDVNCIVAKWFTDFLVYWVDCQLWVSQFQLV